MAGAPSSLVRMRATPAKTATVIPHTLLASNLLGMGEITMPADFILAGDIRHLGGLDAKLYTLHSTSGDEKAAMVMLSQSPVYMDVLLASSGIVFEDIMLQHPELAPYLKTTTSGRNANLWLGAAPQLDAQISLAKQSVSSSIWVVYAKAMTGFRLSKVVPNIPA